jgi:hypothetical protein
LFSLVLSISTFIKRSVDIRKVRLLLEQTTRESSVVQKKVRITF